MRALLVTITAATLGCAVPRLAASVPDHDHAWIAVLSGALDPPLDKVGRHAWIVASVPGENGYRKWEYLSQAFAETIEDPLDHSYLYEIAVHGVVEDTPEIIREKVACLDDFVEKHQREKPKYRLLPGPNSNTFVARALRSCGVHVELPATAVGRDYLGPIGASVTESGTGVQVESFVLGLRVGLREGVEVHLVGVALGVHFWPPGITVPLNPGRIGLDFDGHRVSERNRDAPLEDAAPRRPREYGLANAWMFLGGRYAPRPDDVGGFAGAGTVGVRARGLFADRVGYALGLDVELGVATPLGFAYATHLYPLGAGVAVGPTGWIAAFLGVGTSGVTGSIPAALEVPAELRAELDLGRHLRVGARGALLPAFFGGARRDRSILGFFDEWIAGGFVRIGATKRTRWATTGGGWFLGVERREVLSGAYWAATLGIEMNLGG